MGINWMRRSHLRNASLCEEGSLARVTGDHASIELIKLLPYKCKSEGTRGWPSITMEGQLHREPRKIKLARLKPFLRRGEANGSSRNLGICVGIKKKGVYWVGEEWLWGQSSHPDKLKRGTPDRSRWKSTNNL